MTFLKSATACVFTGLLVLCANMAYAGPGTCISGSQNDADCQFEAVGRAHAPSPSGINGSKGVRLNQGVKDVLFNLPSNNPYYADIGPRFMSNNGASNLFVPQASSTELQKFLDAASSNAALNMSVNFAVKPTIYRTTPAVYPAECDLTPLQPSELSISVPDVSNYSGDVVIVDSYTRYVPNATTTTVSKKVRDGNEPISFLFAPRDECSTDERNHTLCASVSYKEEQTLKFSAAHDGASPYGWATAWKANPEEVSHNLYVKVGTAGYVPTTSANCAVGKYAPPLDAVCCVECATSLMCTRGNLVTTGVGAPDWTHDEYVTWTCLGINGGANASCKRLRNKIACTSPWGTNVAPGMSITAYSATDAPCESETRTCDGETGILGGSYQYENCSAVCDETFLGAKGTACTAPKGAHGYFYNLGNGFSTKFPNARPDALTALNRIGGIDLYATQFDIPHQNYGASRYGPTVPTSFFGVCYDGSWAAPAAGSYTFVSQADDVIALYIDGVLVRQNSYGYVSNTLFSDPNAAGAGVYSGGWLYNGPTEASGGAGGTFTYLGSVPVGFAPITLTKGLHDIEVRYIQNWPCGMGFQLWVLPVGSTYPAQNMAGTVPEPSDSNFMRFTTPRFEATLKCP